MKNDYREPGNLAFASDNYAGVHPEVMAALVRANTGYAGAYGDDDITREAEAVFKRHFGEHARCWFVYNGTGANIVAIAAMTRSFHSVVCSETAHIHVDECGAPEKGAGCKLVPLASEDGKITIDQIKACLGTIGFVHHSQPKVVSITQATELGAVYTPDEIRDICRFAHDAGLHVHMDGARIANAAAAVGCSLRELTTDAGVDMLSFGGTKNGLMFGEAIVDIHGAFADVLPYHRKQLMQLTSKMRFIAAQFTALLSGNLWYENALAANRAAEYLGKSVTGLPGVRLARPVSANAVFVHLPETVIPLLQAKVPFYVWEQESGLVRWMTAFDTRFEDIDAFVDICREVID